MLQMSLFFCTMIMHSFMLAPIKNGLQICRYVVYHSEEFDHPVSAYFLGMSVLVVNVACAGVQIK